MDSILNPDELDALRAAVEQDVLPATAAGRSESVILDGAALPRFRFGESRVGQAQREERLSSVLNKAARALGTRLADILEAAVTVSVTWLEETRFSAFRETFEVDSRELASVEFRVPGVAGTGLVCLEPELVEKMIEGLMGGATKGDAPRLRRTQRAITELDLRVSRRWVSGFLADLGQAINPAEPLDLTIVNSDASGAAARAYGDSVGVVAALLEIVMGRRTIGLLGIVLPRGATDAMAAAHSRDHKESAAPTAHGPLAPALPDFEVSVEVALGSRRLTVRELLSLNVGDVLFLDPRQTTTGTVQGVPKFSGIPGALNGHKAVQIATRLGRTDDHV